MAGIASKDAACELARRSRGTLRRLDREGLRRAAASTPIERWTRCGKWSPIHVRHRAAIELAALVLDPSAAPGGPSPVAAALAPLDPDPVPKTIEDDEPVDWRMLLLASAVPGAEAERGGWLLAAARALEAEVRETDDSETGMQRRSRLAERAARCLLLRSLVRHADIGANALEEGRKEAEKLEVNRGTWSGLLLNISLGWPAPDLAELSIKEDLPDAALRRWELAAVTHAFRDGEPAPPGRPAGCRLPQTEAHIFEDCLRRLASGPWGGQPQETVR